MIEAFIAWADKQNVSGNGKFAKVVTYLRNRRDYLMTYLDDGRCSLSNNWSENSVRPITVGRKNWLFSTSVDGANASMGIYTIVEMASLYGRAVTNILNICLSIVHLWTCPMKNWNILLHGIRTFRQHVLRTVSSGVGSK